jgi:hypothetical protein
MLEDVDALLGLRALVEKLMPDQFSKMWLQGAAFPDGVEETDGEFATQDGCGL